jgi:acetolactate synthase small subunit
MEEKYLITIKAEDRSGLLHLVTGVIERRLVKIISLSYAPTDVHGIVLITIEVSGDEDVLKRLARKLENIVEIFNVELSNYNSALCLRATYFKMSKAFLETPKAIVMSAYDTNILKFYPETFLLAKYGTDATIRKLYNELDGPHLVGFSQTALISDSLLIGEDQSSVIRKAA